MVPVDVSLNIASFCEQDFEGDQVIISYSKNGEDLGTCFEIAADTLEGRALFPHILTKNCSFECNFGQLVSSRVIFSF